MLTRLYIRDFAIISEVEIEFGPGFNVITGETGAGKSILMGALYSILGGPTSADLVRSGAEKCLVEGLFEFEPEEPTVARLAALDLQLEEGQLILRREIRASGRSRAFIDGLAVPLKRLRQIGGILVDLHGQHEHQSLLDPQLHGGFLDAFGRLAPRLESLAALHRDWRRCEGALQTLQQERQQLVAEEELRQFQLREIRELAPQPGEEERLEAELHIQENAETMLQLCGELCDALYQADGSVVEQLGRARRQLDRLLEIDLSLGEQAASLEGLILGIEDLAATLRDYAQRLEVDPRRSEQLRERLDDLRRLKHKYGGSLEALLELASGLERQESRSGELDGEIARTESQRRELCGRFAAACLQLSARRQEAAQKLSRSIARGLRSLGMPQVAFAAELRRRPDPRGPVEADGQRWSADARGMEEIEFHIAPNPGEDPRPLARIASGGEISRIMLVFKEAIAEQDTVSTLVFDEIDVGISGRIAAAVGKKLRALSTSHQTIAITHLPQIAGLAERHFSVRKRQQQGRTVTEVHLLAEEERTEEIAHLLAGESVSATARRHAREMIR